MYLCSLFLISDWISQIIYCFTQKMQRTVACLKLLEMGIPTLALGTNAIGSAIIMSVRASGVNFESTQKVNVLPQH